MTFLEELKNLGGDTDEGLERVMGDSGLYETLLDLFVETLQDNPVAPEDFGGDLEPLIKTVHMLKGAAGNLSLTPVFHGYNSILGLLREGNPVQARREFEALLPVQTQLLACIRRHQAP